MGLFHIYLRLVFADGSAWLACLPEPNCPSAGEELTNSILFNECVNLKWLEEIGFPAPRLHAYGFRNDPHNGVGVSFMLISEVPGRPLNEVIATEGELEKVYTQLAELYSKFSQFPFPQIGSLTMDQDGHYKIGPLIGNHRATLSHLGSFENANEYYAAIAKDYQNLIADGQLFVDYPVNAYIIYKHLEELAKHGKLNQFSPDLNDGPFFFQHENHVQNHIFVDERFNITGLVDWSFARIVPIYEAFGPLLVTADDNLIFNGVPRLSEEDRLLAKALYAKCPDLARLSNSPDTVRRFMFGLGHRMGLEFTEALKLFNEILATLDEDIVCDWEEWREVAISRWTNDQRLVALINNSTRDI